MQSKGSVDETIPRYMLWLLWAATALCLVTAAVRPTSFSWRQAVFGVVLASGLTYSNTAGRRDTWRTPHKWLFLSAIIAALMLALIPFVHHS